MRLDIGDRWINDGHRIKFILSHDTVRSQCICPYNLDYPWNYWDLEYDHQGEDPLETPQSRMQKAVQCGVNSTDYENTCWVSESLADIGIEANVTAWDIILNSSSMPIDWFYVGEEFWFKCSGYPDTDWAEDRAKEIAAVWDRPDWWREVPGGLIAMLSGYDSFNEADPETRSMIIEEMNRIDDARRNRGRQVTHHR